MRRTSWSRTQRKDFSHFRSPQFQSPPARKKFSQRRNSNAIPWSSKKSSSVSLRSKSWRSRAGSRKIRNGKKENFKRSRSRRQHLLWLRKKRKLHNKQNKFSKIAEAIIKVNRGIIVEIIIISLKQTRFLKPFANPSSPRNNRRI